MARGLSISHRWFVIAIAVTILLTIAPQRWLGWTRDVSNVVFLPLAPMSQAGVGIGSWLRPSADPDRGKSPMVRELESEIERWQAEFDKAMQEVMELREQVAELQHVIDADMSATFTPIRASIVGRMRAVGNETIRVRAGTDKGVLPDTIAVYKAVHLIGRVTDVGPFLSTMMPLENMSNQPMTARVYAADRPDAPLAPRADIQVRPVGDGTFMARVSNNELIDEGDVVKLQDEQWPDEAQQMTIGYVESARRDDESPHWKEIIIRPRYSVRDITKVFLKVPVERTVGGEALP